MEEAQLLQTAGGTIGFDIIFKQLQFLGKNYLRSPLGISR